ncbi:MAG: putative Uroporphyrinogen-III decarboxylase-like protein [Holophagaceae bacterium]|nr:putative Uroporphyrinogen-III decarboxylase-like protein [Holophagaceae bacterium]
MSTPQELLTERQTRLRKALALEKVDRTPIILQANSFCASHMGVSLADFCKNFQFSHEIMLRSIKELGDVDGFNAAFSEGALFPLIFMSKVKLPGRELGPDELWQLDESEMMTPEDYDTIINKGWSAFKADYLRNRLGVDVDDLLKQLECVPSAVKNFNDAGYLVYSELVATSVNEYFGGGRSMAKYMTDLYRMPDKVEAATDVVLAEQLEEMRQQIRAIKPTVVFVSPARGASQFYRPKFWDRFVWKYVKATADMIIEEGAVCNIHADADWERDLSRFRDFPKGKIVFETDGGTDIYKIKEAIGDRVCIKGDVPATLLVLGTPDEVYNYSCKLIKDMGEGFILSSGCSVPPNAKLENMKAMIAAATGK